MAEEDNTLNPDTDIMFEIKITAMKDGSINVAGPIKNFMLFRDIMNAAERAVLTKLADKQINEKRIVVPNITPGRN